MTLLAATVAGSGVPGRSADSAGAGTAGRFFAGLRRLRSARSRRTGGSVLTTEPTSFTRGMNSHT